MPVRLEALTLAHLDALQEVVIRPRDYYELVEGAEPIEQHDRLAVTTTAVERRAPFTVSE
jgi:hypothetical protein